MEVIVFLIFAGMAFSLVARMHGQTQRRLTETNENVLNHRLAIRKLDDARDDREQRLLLEGRK